ncbi:MAG: hypothetical protein DHS20C15_21460 [Planctomycetota bacterium]|nr:MAG: hypothetical protein DHS20C15_21460 [Planctomycetota bacterium]
MKGRLRKFSERKFVRDTVALQVGSVVTSGTYLVTSVLTARGLGKEDLGRWATSREMYMFVFFLVSMGLTNAAVSLYSHAKGAQDHERSVKALASLLKAGLFVSIAVMLIGIFALPSLAEHFYDGDRELGNVSRILSIAIAGEMLRGLTLAVLNGTRQMVRYAIFDVSTNVLRVALVGIALLIQPTPRAVAWSYVAHGVLTAYLTLRAYAKARRELGPSVRPPPLGEVLRAVPRARLGELLGISTMLAMVKAMNVVVPRLGMLFIPALAVVAADGFKANGAYQIGNVLTMVLTGAVGAIGTNVLPTLGVKQGQDGVPFRERGALMRKISLTSGSFSILMAVLSVPFMWLVIRYAYGAEYEDVFDFYLRLATGHLFIGFAVIVEPFYIYAKKLKVHVSLSIVFATLATTGIFLATKYYGPKGAALAGGLCKVFVLCHLVYIWLYFRKHARDEPTESVPAEP